jgi:hypothetical protein
MTHGQWNQLVPSPCSAQSLPSKGVEIIGNITRWDYLFLERGTRNGSSNCTWMQVRQRPHSGELVFDGEARGGGSRVDAQLVEDGAHMPLHGARANH